MSSVAPPQRTENDGRHTNLCFEHDVVISRLAYLPDGRRVVTGFRDGTVKVRNVESRKQEGATMRHATEILTGLAVTRDGTKIISSDFGGKVKVWDVDSHELVKEWTHPERWPRIAISPDDRLIAVGHRAVAIYSMEGRQVKDSIEVAKTVCSMSFSLDGRKLACGTDDDIRVYYVESGTLILGPLWGHHGVFDKGSYDASAN